MKTDEMVNLFYSRDVNKIKEVLTPLIIECNNYNKTNLVIGDFRFDFENLTLNYNCENGYLEYSKLGMFKKTENIFDVQVFAITSEEKNIYEKEMPLLQTISSIEIIGKDIYETHHFEVINSNIPASQLIKDLEKLEFENGSRALISTKIQPTENISYIESFLINEYLKPVTYNEVSDQFEKINLIRKQDICENHILKLVEEELVLSILYKIMIEILLNR